MKDKQAKYPQLRFKGFTDPWVQRNLGEWSDVRDGTHASPKYIEQGHPMVTSKNLTDSGLDMSDVSYLTDEDFNEINQRSKVDIGDILFGMIGTIGKPVIVDRNDFAIKNVALIKEKTSPEIINTWLIQYLKSPSFERFIQKENAGGTQKFIALGLIRDMKLMTPSVQEQTRIGELLNHLDNLIAANQRKLDLLKEQKKGYLQKMFPKNGEKVPELRFAGFADDWEERKLSSGLREYTDRVIVEDDKEYSQISVRNNFGGITLRGSKMGNKIGRKRQAKINLTKYPQTLIFTRQTVEQGGIGWVDKYCDGAIVTENMPTISLDTSVFSKYFLTNLFQTRIFYKNAILDNVEGGSAQIAIHESKFLSSTLLFPNLDEQEKIGEFFKQLDKAIALHQRKLDLLKEQKKGFLQKMFV